MTSKVEASGKKRAKTGGRKAGVPNKVTREVKEMVITALTEVGGSEYLKQCAMNEKTASAFLTLVGKVLPLQLTGKDGASLTVTLRADDADV